MRLAGIYLAMLTLAFAQITYAVAFQWVEVTGGDNGVVGVWPSRWAAAREAYYYLALAVTAAAVVLLRRGIYAPFGYTLRAARNSAARADAVGIDVRAHRWLAFTIAGAAAGLAGGLFAFSKGSIDPTLISIPMSVDFLVMTLLGGVQTVVGPLVGAAAFHSIRDLLMPLTDHWRLLLGLAIIAIVLAFPRGIVGSALQLRSRLRLGRCGSPGAREGPSMNLLGVEALSKSFGGVVAARDVTFAVEAGKLLAVIGPNGAGKSTIFNMVGGQLRPDSGRVMLAGHDITGLAPRRIWRLGVGRTFQVAQTFVSMTVAENVQMALISRHGRTRAWWPDAGGLYREEAVGLLDRVGMGADADRPSSELAYGDVKRVELAIALAGAPKLLLMDEPTAGMAPKERAQLMELVHGIARERGLGVLFTEHDMDAVFAHADSIIVLVRGEIIATGRPDEVRANARVREVYLGGSGHGTSGAMRDAAPAPAG